MRTYRTAEMLPGITAADEKAFIIFLSDAALNWRHISSSWPSKDYFTRSSPALSSSTEAPLQYRRRSAPARGRISCAISLAYTTPSDGDQAKASCIILAI